MSYSYVRLRLCPKVLVSDCEAWQFASQFTVSSVYGSRVCVLCYVDVHVRTPVFRFLFLESIFRTLQYIVVQTPM